MILWYFSRHLAISVKVKILIFVYRYPKKTKVLKLWTQLPLTGAIFKMADANVDEGQSYKYLICCSKNLYFDTNIMALGDAVLRILVK